MKIFKDPNWNINRQTNRTKPNQTKLKPKPTTQTKQKTPDISYAWLHTKASKVNKTNKQNTA